MMNKAIFTRSWVRFAGVAMAAMGTMRTARAADAPATQPTTQPAVAGSVDALTADVEKQFARVQDVLDDNSTLTDPTKRAAAAPAVIPILQKLVSDFDGLAADPDTHDQAVDRRAEFTMFLSLFGDEKATKHLADEAASTDANVALEGKRGQLMTAWLSSSLKPEVQIDLVKQTDKLAQANITNVPLTIQIFQMSQMGASTPEFAKQLQTIVTDVMKNEVADSAKTQLQASQKLAELENKPITIAGKLVGGKDFTTADWKGKVVLVDFWATWCGPCRAELPRVKKMYADYHAKGLEVLGVSNDYEADDLTSFLTDNKDMPWPQLFDAEAAKNQKFSPITLGYGIDGIPTMFLIDKKGICRSVTARENMEELIPKMLDEK